MADHPRECPGTCNGRPAFDGQRTGVSARPEYCPDCGGLIDGQPGLVDQLYRLFTGRWPQQTNTAYSEHQQIEPAINHIEQEVFNVFDAFHNDEANVISYDSDADLSEIDGGVAVDKKGHMLEIEADQRTVYIEVETEF